MKDKEFRLLLADDWKKIKTKISGLDLDDESCEIIWSYYISEPFPSEWPVTPKTTLYFYVYGEGQDLNCGLDDAFCITAPWARIEYDFRQEELKGTNILSDKLKIIGTQGIQAMDAREIGAFDHAVSLGKYLITHEQDRSAKHLKNYYCLWIKHHSTLMKKIIPLHKEFIAWLAC